MKKYIIASLLAVFAFASTPMFSHAEEKNARENHKIVKEKAKQKQTEKLQKVAKKLNIDINGLSNKEAKEKIKTELKNKKMNKIKKIADKRGVNIDDLSMKEAIRKIKESKKAAQ
jgi:regulatory protein YycH of two-component signal transduction system YycFG